ncbi:MAG: hypothetical protein PHN49_12065 [Candidatus Omnitrophica bacterium]|nr:hypothetical protein [Candidatus Omnitrophota bacterium]
MGQLVNSQDRFEKRRRLIPILPRLLGVVLRYVSTANKEIYSQLERDLTAALCHPIFPELTLDDEQFMRLERQVIPMDGMSDSERDEICLSAEAHMRVSLNFDPSNLPSFEAYLDNIWYRMALNQIFGMLSLAWQIKTGQQLVTSLHDYYEAHPDIAARLKKPR